MLKASDTMKESGALTDVNHWDDFWRAFPIRKVSSNDVAYGEHGYFLHPLRHRLGSLKDKKVVEIGGGGSYKLLSMVKWCGAKGTAIDYSERGLKATEDLFKINDSAIELLCEDFFDWKPGDRRFDVVCHFGVIEHFTDPDLFLQHCARLLNEGGTMYFSMPNMNAWGAQFWRKWAPKDWSCHYYHSDEAVQMACRQAGLELTEIFHWGSFMVKNVNWEQTGFFPTCMTLLQRSVNLLNRLIPIYRLSAPRLSSGRGFIARKK